MIHDVLNTCKLLCDGTLGTWKTKTLYIYKQLYATPYHTNPQHMTGAYKNISNKEVEMFYQLCILKKLNIIVSIPHIYPIKKNGIVRLLSNFRKLNKGTYWKQFSILK